VTPAGIEPVTNGFVTQHLNHCATAKVNMGLFMKVALHKISLSVCYFSPVIDNFTSAVYTSLSGAEKTQLTPQWQGTLL